MRAIDTEALYRCLPCDVQWAGCPECWMCEQAGEKIREGAKVAVAEESELNERLRGLFE